MATFRRFVRAAVVPLLGLAIGCSPLALGSGDGCGSVPQATDAATPGVALRAGRPPCGTGLTAVRGTDPHLVVSFQCPGESSPFLLGVRVDGALHSLHEVRGAGFGTTVTLDAGPWEPADGSVHAVEVVLDPLNLFHESDESNNRTTATLRIVPPDLAIEPAACGFILPQGSGGDGVTLVSEVFEGFPVDVRLRFVYGGPYEAVAREITDGVTVLARDTVSATCETLFYPVTNLAARWTPPGPGTYTVTFRVTPIGGPGDADAGNNSVEKTLRVRDTGSAR